ncbi:AAA family ATPase [Nocardioides marinquilinus]|uniref:AAA family ATPase n=1 Tax=Nocardioides marinquilinus TaxID=1210400 RepID=A0ABP9Q4T7_9ACTN
MIVWLNGTFGVGKTTTARRLVERDPRLRLFDPEWVGYLLREHLADVPVDGAVVTDFQQWPSWRRLVPVVADEVATATGQPLVAVQTVLVEAYWRELRAGLRARDHEVLHVVLTVADDEAVRRIETDEVEAGAVAWRLRHREVWAAARGWMTAAADLVVDTTDRTPDDVAATVAAAVDRHLGGPADR